MFAEVVHLCLVELRREDGVGRGFEIFERGAYTGMIELVSTPIATILWSD